MIHEQQPEIPVINDCRAYRETLKLNYTILKMQNDERQKAIAEDMIKRSQLEILALADDLEQDLVGNILDTIESLLGTDQNDNPSAEHTPFYISRYNKKIHRLLSEEYNRQDDINQAIEFFGLEINGYNKLFIDYIDNFALYNNEGDLEDYSSTDIIDIIYSPSDQENHFHPNRQPDLNMGCVACSSLVLKDAFNMPDIEARNAYLKHQENKRNFWLQHNIVDV